MALRDNLIFNYHLNSSTADNSGNGNTLTLNGATYDTSIKMLGSASLNFDGIDDEAEASDSASLDIVTDFTMATWLYLTELPSTSGNAHTLISKSDSAAVGDRSYLLEINPTTDKVRILYFDSSGNLSRIEMDTAFVGGDLNSWTLLWVDVDISAATANFYRDNSLDTDTVLNSAASTIGNSSATFRLGSRDTTPGSFLKGKLDEVSGWDAIKSTADRNAFWNGGSGIEIPAASAFRPHVTMVM